MSSSNVVCDYNFFESTILQDLIATMKKVVVSHMQGICMDFEKMKSETVLNPKQTKKIPVAAKETSQPASSISTKKLIIFEKPKAKKQKVNPQSEEEYSQEKITEIQTRYFDKIVSEWDKIKQQNPNLIPSYLDSIWKLYQEIFICKRAVIRLCKYPGMQPEINMTTLYIPLILLVNNVYRNISQEINFSDVGKMCSLNNIKKKNEISMFIEKIIGKTIHDITEPLRQYVYDYYIHKKPNTNSPLAANTPSSNEDRAYNNSGLNLSVGDENPLVAEAEEKVVKLGSDFDIMEGGKNISISEQERAVAEIPIGEEIQNQQKHVVNTSLDLTSFEKNSNQNVEKSLKSLQEDLSFLTEAKAQQPQGPYQQHHTYFDKNGNVNNDFDKSRLYNQNSGTGMSYYDSYSSYYSTDYNNIPHDGRKIDHATMVKKGRYHH